MRAARRTVAGCILALGAAAACTIEPRTDTPVQQAAAAPEAGPPYRQVIQPEGTPRLPVFSSAIRHGDILYMSGQLGAVPGVNPPRLVEGGVEPETRQTFENMRTVLEAAGLGFENVIKCTVFLADIADYAAVNAIYIQYFEGMDPPARSAMAASGLALGARVEIECLAAYPPGA